MFILKSFICATEHVADLIHLGPHYILMSMYVMMNRAYVHCMYSVPSALISCVSHFTIFTCVINKAKAISFCTK